MDVAHRTWCRVIENFLWILFGRTDDIPADVPRRGIPLPGATTKLVTQMVELAPRAIGISTSRCAKFVGRAKDLKARLARWTKKCQGEADTSDPVDNDTIWRNGSISEGDAATEVCSRERLIDGVHHFLDSTTAATLHAEWPSIYVGMKEEVVREATEKVRKEMAVKRKDAAAFTRSTTGADNAKNEAAFFHQIRETKRENQ